MKNVIIVVLALLSVFLGYKAYFSPHADAKTGEAEEVSETYAMLMEQGVFDVQSIDPEYGIDVNVMIKHFHKFTLPRLRNPGTPNDENGTDGTVTSTIEFSKETLKKIMRMTTSLLCVFTWLHLRMSQQRSMPKYMA
jgi:hypothetical protein